MGAYIGFKANSDISLPLTGGKLHTIKAGDYVINDSMDASGKVVYMLHVNINRVQDAVKIEVPATADSERIVKAYSACGDISYFKTVEEMQASMMSQRESSPKADTAAKKSAPAQSIKMAEQSSKKENLFKCAAVAGLICIGIYWLAKK